MTATHLTIGSLTFGPFWARAQHYLLAHPDPDSRFALPQGVTHGEDAKQNLAHVAMNQHPVLILIRSDDRHLQPE